jgi:hypothetical protein
MEMKFGILKCGVMGVGGNAKRKVRHWENRWLLQGELLPVVTEYTYLGLLFTHDLQSEAMVQQRAAKGNAALDALTHVISNRNIPVYIRILMVKAIIVPTLTFGGEIWGMNDTLAVICQRVLSRALRSLVGVKSSNVLSAEVASCEFDIPPISAIVAGLRTRALLKYPTLRTVVAQLVQHATQLGSAKHSWTKGGRIWLKRYGGPGFLMTLTPTEGSTLVRTNTWNRHQDHSTAVTLHHYLRSHFFQSSAYLKRTLWYPNDSVGVQWLTKARLGVLWPTRRYARIGLVRGDPWLQRCPFCNEESLQGETVEHLFVVCPTWLPERREFLWSALEWLVTSRFGTWHALLGSAVFLQEAVVYLLGGHVDGIDDDDHPPDLMPKWCRIPVYDPNVLEVDEPPGVRLPVFIQVARYLQRIMPRRLHRLHDLMQTPRADANVDGMAVLADADPPGNVLVDIHQGVGAV